ncbi:YHYH protein [Maribacter polysiphoniae]|uniref:YHYH protein n=1 Tax=Maribacter polysiphoniae TaxID=429344 RepID=UPI00235279A6|nr:YHYH protein [Maribacter polysiphoniae]
MKKIALLLLLTLVFSCKSNNRQNQGPEDRQRPSATQIISEFDTDKDGKLSETEVHGPLAEDFLNIDTDKDGFLTESELENGPKPPPPMEQHENSVSPDDFDTTVKSVPVNTDLFIKENIIGEIAQETISLSGVETLCYVIKTHSQATEHPMGPWCPRHIEDGLEKAGIWFEEGKVYDVSGHFIADLAEFYSDDKWRMYNEDGTINVTLTKEACLAAAKPDVDEAYNNYCVECMPDFFKDQVTTFVIPVQPQYLTTAQSFGRGAIGMAFNGVNFDPPAPTHAILAAHTIAPLDDHGGHVNPHGGYHYHAVTGSTKEIAQEDVHAPMVGYAIDGFGIYALLDKNGDKPENLDECGGHSDKIRGYHYHAGEPGGNQIISCLHGLPGYTEVQE